ncbi:nuclease-related domain-containing protein [Macrococcus brunensis]|nr:nuclease-related domain-containing protein [Macrococcus brunensis]
MAYKTRPRPQEIIYSEALENRFSFEISNSIIGYDGEALFAEWLYNLPNACVLWDIHLSPKYKGEVQYDFIVNHELTVYHFDVKNYKGQYHYVNENLQNSYRRIIKNPELQLQRAHEYLSHVINQFDSIYSVESYICFVNETFYMEAPPKYPHWLMRPQIFHKLDELKVANSNSANNRLLADYLIRQHIEKEEIFKRVPIEHIRKGLKCPSCMKINAVKTEIIKFKCVLCNTTGKNADLIHFNLEELYVLKNAPIDMRDIQLFFPEIHRSSVQRVLAKYFIRLGASKKPSYVPKV